jgi:hypothetical protein
VDGAEREAGSVHRRTHDPAREEGVLGGTRGSHAFSSGRAYKLLTVGVQNADPGQVTSAPVSEAALPDLRRTTGYLVADVRGRVVGRVECPMYGRTHDTPDALSVRSGFLSRRRRLVPAETIQEIDGSSRVVGLKVERDAIRAFL